MDLNSVPVVSVTKLWTLATLCRVFAEAVVACLKSLTKFKL